MSQSFETDLKPALFKLGHRRFLSILIIVLNHATYFMAKNDQNATHLIVIGALKSPEKLANNT